MPKSKRNKIGTHELDFMRIRNVCCMHIGNSFIFEFIIAVALTKVTKKTREWKEGLLNQVHELIEQ